MQLGSSVLKFIKFTSSNKSNFGEWDWGMDGGGEREK